MSGVFALTDMDVDRIVRAAERVTDYVVTTGLEPSKFLRNESGAELVLLKRECDQLTGSFKVRGAVNALLCLLEDDAHDEVDTVVAASTGNHARAVLYAVQLCKRIRPQRALKAVLFVPSSIKSGKLAALKGPDASVEFYGDTVEEAESYARQWAATRPEAAYISPCGDLDVIAGQGTIGVEIYRQIRRNLWTTPDYVLVPVGGGGMVAGIASYLRSVWPSTRVLGVQPAVNACMKLSLEAGHIVEDFVGGATIADGLAGGIEPGCASFELCRDLLDGVLVVDEDQIRRALALVLASEHQVLEGAAAVTVAALLKHSDSLFREKTVVLVLCGRNVDMQLVREVAASVVV